MERFVDEASIFVKAGDGGNGCVSFRREKYAPRGGPNGGNGGDGGSIIFYTDPQVETLLDFKFRPKNQAKSGQPGMGNDKFGRKGEDLRLHLPLGTIVKDRDTDEILHDLDVPELEVVIAKGGKGGRGNLEFKHSTNQTPRYAEEGTDGEERWLKLELKLVADVGLVGLPNAGKSTFLSRVSAATPKIAAYPFTTLKPQLGLVAVNDKSRFVLADLPGLIEGAHRGVGLGDRFLRHIERTRILLFFLDTGGLAETSPAEAFRILHHELASYSKDLAQKPALVAANKMDLTEAKDELERLQKELQMPIFPISAVTGEGIRSLLDAILQVLAEFKKAPVSAE
ncbi:MAG: GTPase ObgE [Planctomycetota bacterium]|nr:GTPase ObgE [Planctomycetota bacterium]